MNSSVRRLAMPCKRMHDLNRVAAGLQRINASLTLRRLNFSTTVESEGEISVASINDSNEQIQEAAAKAKDAKADIERRKWWKPDPMTGVWSPDQQAQADTVKLREEFQIKEEQVISTLCERVWWSSLEEIPERH
ncbi:hypothetical protein O6H91_15G054900 [Diphasiastrum complanatum]|uniref:Uncharacterized protein n=1 Tax=Diphasiastrum complanatum TaxID=34168 RepID=A0ACC2BID8_DIPCM|nr:hypothetical protein O6H91_Y181200 [Diphasiastrum complanatum]KAJ7529526.1 hypothetical protein O6H91_15G054900 [Diphasiastrum complanatum]